MDPYKNWLRAEVLAIDADKGNVKIHYSDLHSSWDEWIAVGDSERLRQRDAEKEAKLLGVRVRVVSSGRRCFRKIPFGRYQTLDSMRNLLLLTKMRYVRLECTTLFSFHERSAALADRVNVFHSVRGAGKQRPYPRTETCDAEESESCSCPH